MAFARRAGWPVLSCWWRRMLRVGNVSFLEGLMATQLLRPSTKLCLALAALIATTSSACSGAGNGAPDTDSVSESLVAPTRPRPGRATPLAITSVLDPLGVGDAA